MVWANLNEAEEAVLERVLASTVFRNLMGAEEWDLTEDEEWVLWGLIKRVEGET